MAHWAQVDPDTKEVINVIVAEDELFEGEDQEFVNVVGGGDLWIKTSYNTRGGIHYDPETRQPSADQTKALRGNFANRGMIYNEEHDVFIYEQPFASWTLNQTTWQWESPLEYPVDGIRKVWDEEAYQADNTTGWVDAPQADEVDRTPIDFDNPPEDWIVPGSETSNEEPVG